MPEGDTVWRTARHLDQALSGHVLLGCDVRVPAYATTDLTGRRVLETVARGKHLLTRVGDDASLTVHTHLRMEGAWHLYRPGTRWQRPAHQARIVLRTEPWVAVAFSLGVVEIVATADEAAVVGHLGPDLLGDDWDLDRAVERFDADPTRAIADALLDQRLVAGIGNIYKNELCFLRGIHPWRPVGDVADLAGMLLRAKQLLEANKFRVEQTTTGDLRPGALHYVYRRAGMPCRRCATLIEVDQQGPSPRERATYWCPRCQPADQPHR